MNAIIHEMMLKIRRVGGSLTVIIPKDIANLYGIDVDSGIEIIPVSRDELNLRFRRVTEK